MPQDAIWYAYFAPYPYERHEELIAEVSLHSHPVLLCQLRQVAGASHILELGLSCALRGSITAKCHPYVDRQPQLRLTAALRHRFKAMSGYTWSCLGRR